MSENNNQANTKKNFFDIVNDIRKKSANVGNTINYALSDKERP